MGYANFAALTPLVVQLIIEAEVLVRKMLIIIRAQTTNRNVCKERQIDLTRNFSWMLLRLDTHLAEIKEISTLTRKMTHQGGQGSSN